MKNKLQNFDLLCQEVSKSLLTQKTHGFLHSLRPFARTKLYLEQNFMMLWNKSCFDKFKFALQSTGLSFNYNQIEVANGQRDIYEGTDRPGIILKYKIYPKDQEYLITEILTRLKNNSQSDDLAPWRAYIEDDIAFCKQKKIKFHLPMELHIIARVRPKQNQSFQNKKAAVISQFNFAGFDGNIYLWFDLKKYKEELKAVIDAEKVKDSEEIVSQQNTSGSDQQDIDIHLTNIQQDKIKIGTLKIDIKDSEKTGILGTAISALTGGIEDLSASAIASGFNRIRGNGKYKDSSEKPDVVRKKFALFGLDKPFVEVVSKVSILDWLYNIEEMPERKYLGAQGTKINVSSLTKFPFDFRNIKKNGNPLNSSDLTNNVCWSVGNLAGNSRWERVPITKDWLLDTNARDHIITLRFQSYVKKDGKYYFEYRAVFKLDGFYTLKDKIDRQKAIISNLPTGTSPTKIAKLESEVAEWERQSSNFIEWFKAYVHQQEKYRPDEFTKASIDKLLYNSKNEFVGRDAHIATSLQQLKQRDISAFEFLTNKILGQSDQWTCQGEPLNQIFSNI